MQPLLWQMLFLSSASVAEANETRQGRMQARWLLRVRARSFEALQLALLRINSGWLCGLGETIHSSSVVEQSNSSYR